jgi:hypothetical protein
METMNKPLLNEQVIFPSNEVLKSVLAESYHAFEQLSVILTNEKGLVLEWNYYKDGHSWLWTRQVINVSIRYIQITSL